MRFAKYTARVAVPQSVHILFACYILVTCLLVVTCWFMAQDADAAYDDMPSRPGDNNIL